MGQSGRQAESQGARQILIIRISVQGETCFDDVKVEPELLSEKSYPGSFSDSQPRFGFCKHLTYSELSVHP